MKAFMKMMRNWTIGFSLVLTSLIFGWAPVTDLLHDMSARQVTIYVIMGGLFIAWVFICWFDSKSRWALNSDLAAVEELPEVKTRKPELLLMYSSALSDRTLRMPVYDATHAQDLIDVMRLKDARVGYLDPENGSEIITHKDNGHRKLVLA